MHFASLISTLCNIIYSSPCLCIPDVCNGEYLGKNKPGETKGSFLLRLAIIRCYNKTLKQVLYEAPYMGTKFSEDIVPLSSLKINPGKVVRQTAETHRPVLLTSHGQGVAVVQSLSDYEKAEEERSFMRAVTEGLMDVEKGRVAGIDEVRKRLGLK